MEQQKQISMLITPNNLWKIHKLFVVKITIIRSKFPDDNELRNLRPSLDIIFLMHILTLATETEIKKLFMK